MRCRLALRRACLVCLVLIVVSGPCHGQSDNDSAKLPTQQASSTQDPYSVLNKYTDDQLRGFISTRRNKSLESNLPADVEPFSDRQIADFVRYRQKALYGEDRRRDFYEIQDPIQLAVVNSVGALVKPNHYIETPDGVELVGKSLGLEKKLCSGQNYETQPVVSYCTAFVVGQDLIATAGHCVPADLKSIRLVFGYRTVRPYENDIHVIKVIPKTQVYKVVDIVKCKYDGWDKENAQCIGNGKGGRTPDYAVLRVDRPIRDHQALPLDTSRGVAVQQELYVVGYPLGLPTKLADQGVVREVSDEGYFVSNLDTFAGNSGSPVLLSGSLMVEGILVRGENDFLYQGTCQVALVCPEGTDCKIGGEDSVLLKTIADVFNLPKSRPPANAASKTPSSEKAIHPPITTPFSSGTVSSGPGDQFSQEYVVTSDPPPPGYQIGEYTATLSGQRTCNAWSTCQTAIENNHVVFRFRLQGHVERRRIPLPLGFGSTEAVVAISTVTAEGHLIVTYKWVGKKM
jgi:V8-like Glu-specific endopeptidase